MTKFNINYFYHNNNKQMNSSHQTPVMNKSVPIWLLKNPQFIEQLKKEKEQRELKEKQKNTDKATITELN